MSWRWIILALTLGVANTAGAQTPRDSLPKFFDLTLGDFKEELQAARDMGKKGIVLFFEMNGCPYCYLMKDKVFNQPEVHDYYKQHFLVFSVDAEGAVEITDFGGEKMKEKEFALQKHKVRAVPSMIFFDLDSKPVARYNRASSNTDEVLRLGEYVVAGAYKDMSFNRYNHEKKPAP